MVLAARTLAATAWDLFEDPKLLPRARAEHRAQRAGRKYRPLLEPDQKPPLDYRLPPRRVPAAGE
jgi:aminobenzoyl-glutamate utilization protein B